MRIIPRGIKESRTIGASMPQSLAATASIFIVLLHCRFS
jgi:hypothetical protein